MSILQEYEENRKILGNGRINAIEDYIEYYKEKNNKEILYSDIVYKQQEYELFDKWFQDKIKPFIIVKHSEELYSLILNENNFNRKIFNNKLQVSGYDYEELIKNYSSNKLSHLYNLDYDSEAGMFAVSSNSLLTLEELAYSFNKDSKNIEYMKSFLPDKELDL